MTKERKHVVWADRDDPKHFYCDACEWEGELAEVGEHVAHNQYDA